VKKRFQNVPFKCNLHRYILGSCRRFLEVLVGGGTATLDAAVNNNGGGGGGGGEGMGQGGGGAVSDNTWHWGGDVFWNAHQHQQQRGEQQQRERGIRGANGDGTVGAGVALHAHRSARPPVSAASAAEDAFGGGRTSRAAAAERSDGREGLPSAAAELSALLFSVGLALSPRCSAAGCI
jgi:hypothetical protein